MKRFKFNQMVGNSGTISMLKRSIMKSTFPNFSLFAGYYGTGKTATAIIGAMALLCENSENGEPCCACPSCTAIMNSLGQSRRTENFALINMPECNSKDHFSDLLKSIFVLNSSEGKCVYIIDEAQGITDKNMQDALLGEIDMMSENVYIIMTTAERGKLIPPLRDRALTFNFYRLSNKEASLLLSILSKERSVKLSPGLQQVILQESKGVPRNIIKLFNFVIDNEVSEEDVYDFFRIISDSDFMELFINFGTTQSSLGFEKLRELVTSHSLDVFVKQLKSFLIEVVLYLETGKSEVFAPDVAQMIDLVFGSVDVFKITQVVDPLDYRTSEEGIEFAFLKIKQILVNKKVSSILSESRQTAAMQNQVLVKDQTEQKKVTAQVARPLRKLSADAIDAFLS